MGRNLGIKAEGRSTSLISWYSSTRHFPSSSTTPPVLLYLCFSVTVLPAINASCITPATEYFALCPRSLILVRPQKHETNLCLGRKFPHPPLLGMQIRATGAIGFGRGGKKIGRRTGRTTKSTLVSSGAMRPKPLHHHENKKCSLLMRFSWRVMAATLLQNVRIPLFTETRVSKQFTRNGSFVYFVESHRCCVMSAMTQLVLAFQTLPNYVIGGFGLTAVLQTKHLRSVYLSYNSIVRNVPVLHSLTIYHLK